MVKKKQYREYQEPVNPVKTYKALLTQTPTYTDSGVLIAGKTYVTPKLEAGDDFANVGYIADNVNFVATGTTPTVWANSTDIYEQVINTPVPTEIENTFADGEITFSFINGVPRLIATGNLTIGKTFILSEYGVISTKFLPNYLVIGTTLTNASILIEVYP